MQNLKLRQKQKYFQVYLSNTNLDMIPLRKKSLIKPVFILWTNILLGA